MDLRSIIVRAIRRIVLVTSKRRGITNGYPTRSETVREMRQKRYEGIRRGKETNLFEAHINLP